MSDEKACSRCALVLPMSMFFRDSGKAGGYDGICKSCKAPARLARAKARYAADLDFRAAAIDRARKSRECDPVKAREMRLAWRHSQREQVTDWWVRKLLAQKKDGIKPRDIPQALVDVKRQHLLLLRLVKEKEQK